MPVRVLEKEVTPRIGQRGAGIQPRSLELLKFLGVLPDVTKLAISLPQMCMYKMPEGIEPAKVFDVTGEPWKPTPDIPYVSQVATGVQRLRVLSAYSSFVAKCCDSWAVKL